MTLIEYAITNSLALDIKNFDKLTAEAQEKIRLETLRMKTSIDALEFAQALDQRATAAFFDSLIDLAPDDEDDFETAYSKAKRLDIIEHKLAEANEKINFEFKEAKRLGFIK